MMKNKQMEKREAYNKLIADVKKYYESGVQGGSYKKEYFKLKWCPECEEINLWTYWQGKKNPNLKAEVLVLGQDWGTAWEKNGLIEYASRILAGKNGFSKRYIDEVRNNSTPTDDNLHIIMKSALGAEYDPYVPDNQKLFFSNLCLGYRDHRNSGGLDKAVLKHDVQYIERLIDIVEPKLVVCLGKDTYDAFVKMSKSVPKNKEESFYKKLAEGTCYAMYNGKIPVFGQSHPGGLGVANRLRYDSEKVKNTGKTGKDLMIADWKKMKKFLK